MVMVMVMVLAQALLDMAQQLVDRQSRYAAQLQMVVEHANADEHKGISSTISISITISIASRSMFQIWVYW